LALGPHKPLSCLARTFSTVRGARRSEAKGHTTKLLDVVRRAPRIAPRVTADALDALGRTEEAKALRERYGVTSSAEP
jgi:hypothetical protein